MNLRSILSNVRSRLLNLEQNSYLSQPRSSHYPLVSGDSFLCLSDHALLRHLDTPLILRQNHPKQILFVEGEVFDRPDVQEYIKQFKCILIHNCDIPPAYHKLLNVAQLGIHIYCVNIISNHPMIHALPIGIENSWHNRNGSHDYYNQANLAVIDTRKLQDVLVSFNVSTNPSERKYAAYVSEKFGYLNNTEMSITDYRRALASNMFVISPPGNGIDCHRTWEALYHKCIPVMERKNLLYPDVRLPILVCDSYEQFFRTSLLERTTLYHMFTNRFYPELYCDWWFDQIRINL
jgi:hypothetical protein